MAMLEVSEKIREELANKQPAVTVKEVEEALLNREGQLLIDNREQHRTTPPTLWFVSRTNRNRILKVMIVVENGRVYLKSAYDATAEVIRIYESKSGTRV